MNEPISVFKSPEGEAKSIAAYDAVLGHWPVPYEELDLPTLFGAIHIIVSGLTGNKPLIILHGQDSCAISWIYNIAEFSQTYRTYAVDTPGDMGKSKPTCLPSSRKEYAEWLLEILEGLKIDKADLMGLSYGGFLATNFALDYSQRVNRLVLLAPGKTNLRHLSFMRPVFIDEELRQITVPIQLLIGDHEIMYEPKKALDRAISLIPNIHAELIPNASHMLNKDQPELVIKKVLGFLSGSSHQGKQ